MYQIKNLHYSIGERVLLNDVQWIINPGKRVALIGPNGAGKTTLLNVLTGELQPDRGDLMKPKYYRISLLPQEETTVGKGPLLAEVLEGQGELAGLESQITQCHAELQDAKEDHDKILKKLENLEHRFEAAGGYGLESEAKVILSGLGFKVEDFERPLSEFSGGWRMRVYLARLLLQRPDLLLLDEPTNHLDIQSLEWLEQYLLRFPGSVVFVSHDRFFIDRLADEIMELDRGRLTPYPGNYHTYETKKADDQALMIKQYEAQQAERERIQKFVDRFRYKATKAAQVQSRIKQLEKMDTLELPETRQRIHFKIGVETKSYKDVVHIENVSFKYTDEWVLENINLNIYRGERLALVGVNGAGKTTLTRLVHEELVPQIGQLKIGQNVEIGYYAQHQIDALNLDATVFDEVSTTAAVTHQTRIRDILGIFQFSGDDVYKKVKILSGGEKARVSLAKMLLSPANFLIMDEPTNHLDMYAKEALEEALSDYEGTLLLIAHDRYFLDKLVSRVVEIRDHHMRSFEGNYSDYLTKRDQFEKPEPEQASTNSMQKEAGAKKTKEQKRAEAEARNALAKRVGPLKREIIGLEQKIEGCEARKAEIEAEMTQSDFFVNQEKAIAVQKEYAELGEMLDQVMKTWEQKQEELEGIVGESE